MNQKGGSFLEGDFCLAKPTPNWTFTTLDFQIVSFGADKCDPASQKCI